MDDRVVGELGPLPAGVAVHRVVAAADGADPAGLAQPALELGEVAAAAVRQGVAAVGEGVEDDVGDPLLGGELDRRLDVLPARVDAAVGDQAEQVQAAARAAPGGVAGGEQRLVVEEAAVGDRVVDPGQVLLDDRPGAEVEVADLRVAHLALGQADVAPLGGELRVREALPEPVEDRRLGERDRVARPRRGEAPAVEDHQHQRGNGHRHPFRLSLCTPRVQKAHRKLMRRPRSRRIRRRRGWRRRPGRRRCRAGRAARRRWRA